MSTLYRDLGYLARRELAVILNHESPRGADWKGLADKMKFSYDTIVSLRGKGSPTQALLEKWEKTAGASANLSDLIAMVESLGCVEGVDILKKEQSRKVNHIDIPKTDGARLAHGVHDASPNPHYPLTPCSSIDPSHLDPEEIRRIQQVQISSGIDPNQLAKGLQSISISGHSSSPSGGQMSTRSSRDTSSPSAQTCNPEQRTEQTNRPTDNGGDFDSSLETIRDQQFDVFLSFAEEDERFAEEVRQRLVENTNAKVFVPSSGLMLGQVFHQEIADMIKEGCSRTVVILSPDYLDSPWCGYEANLALMKSPDAQTNSTVPILYKKCEVPSFLTHLYYLDYPRFKDNRKDCEEYFWKRLYKAMTFRR